MATVQEHVDRKVEVTVSALARLVDSLGSLWIRRLRSPLVLWNVLWILFGFLWIRISEVSASALASVVDASSR